MMRKTNFPILRLAMVALSALALLAACDNEPDGPRYNAGTTLLFYLGGDNNLGNEISDKVEAIRGGWHPATGDRLLIYGDVNGSSPFFIEITADGGSKTIRELSQEDSADNRVFARVLNDVRSLYPSKSYGLVVFSHGTGWLPPGAMLDPRAASPDKESGDSRRDDTSSRSIIQDGNAEMELSDFAAAIPDGMFDFIVFEACLMSGIEVAYELKDKAERILASSAEIISPGFQPVYTTSLDKLFKGNITGFAEDLFVYFDGLYGVRRSATISVVNTSRLDALAQWVAGNCDFGKEIDLSALQHFDRGSGGHLFFDLEDYYGATVAPEKAGQLMSLLGECVVWKAATSEFMLDLRGYYIVNHSGLTAYAMQDGFPDLNKAYKNLKWYKAAYANMQR